MDKGPMNYKYLCLLHHEVNNNNIPLLDFFLVLSLNMMTLYQYLKWWALHCFPLPTTIN